MSDLRTAAQAVLDRWDSPQWEWSTQGPTADLMANLRRAVEQREQRDALLEALKKTTAHLISAHSLLQSGGKKAAASDSMFELMLADYEKSIETGRAAIKAVEVGR